MAPKVAIVYYSMYGHVRTMALAEKAGIEKAGGTCDLYQVQETLPTEVLEKMHAPTSQTGDKILSDPSVLEAYDAFLFGIPTRYGNFPAQWKAFWDKTGGQWQTGAYWGKYVGVFVSTATPGGGQESTVISTMSTFVHHGMIFVPLGYKTAFAQLADLSEVRGGSPWGAGTFSAGDGSRQPSEKELQVATIQGESFYNAIKRVDFPASAWLHGSASGEKATAAAAAGEEDVTVVEEEGSGGAAAAAVGGGGGAAAAAATAGGDAAEEREEDVAPTDTVATSESAAGAETSPAPAAATLPPVSKESDGAWRPRVKTKAELEGDKMCGMKCCVQ